MEISEPTTMLTDYLLGLITFIFAGKLLKQSRINDQKSVKLWAIAFIALGLSAFTGGTYHGFTPQLSNSALKTLWKLTAYSIGFADLFLISSISIASFTGAIRRLLIGFGAAKFTVFSIWMISHDSFRYIIYDYGATLLFLLVVNIKELRAPAALSSKWIITGILITVGGSLVQMSGFSLHKHFNHNDIYHIIQMIAVYAFFRAGLLLRDKVLPAANLH